MFINELQFVHLMFIPVNLKQTENHVTFLLPGSQFLINLAKCINRQSIYTQWAPLTGDLRCS